MPKTEPLVHSAEQQASRSVSNRNRKGRNPGLPRRSAMVINHDRSWPLLLEDALHCPICGPAPGVTIGPSAKPSTLMHTSRNAFGTQQERRCQRRFPLHYPVSLKVCRGDSNCELQTVSQNMGVQGILVQADRPVPQDCEASFVITVQEKHIVRLLRLVGDGRVVRVEPNRSGVGFLIALQCSQPMSDMRHIF